MMRLLTFSILSVLLGYGLSQNGDIPTGASSLAFVFDITGSMYDDLLQVIEGARKIMAVTLARRVNPLYNYILVPFHDPGNYPVMRTFKTLDYIEPVLIIPHLVLRLLANKFTVACLSVHGGSRTFRT